VQDGDVHSSPTRRSSDLTMTTGIDRFDADTERCRGFSEKQPGRRSRRRLFVAIQYSQQQVTGLGSTLNAVVVIAGAGLLLRQMRSEEHSSELQSRENLVC